MKEVPKDARCLSCRWYRPEMRAVEVFPDPPAMNLRTGKPMRSWTDVPERHGKCYVNPPVAGNGLPVTTEDGVCRRWEPEPL